MSYNESNFSNCHFLPLNYVEEILKKVKENARERKVNEIPADCRRNLVQLQRKQNVRSRKLSIKWTHNYHLGIKKAICAHDWDKLHFLLTESPIWERKSSKDTVNDLDNYVRALTILLMYHPSAKAQSLLNQYMHMVLGCRSDEDKKALTKILVALPDKYINRAVQFQKNVEK